MFAVLVAEILIKPFGAVRGIRVGELSGWLEVSQGFRCRSNFQIVEHGIAPVCPKCDGIFSSLQHDHTAGSFFKGQVVGEADFALIDTIDIQVLYFFVGVVWFAVADG